MKRFLGLLFMAAVVVGCGGGKGSAYAESVDSAVVAEEFVCDIAFSDEMRYDQSADAKQLAAVLAADTVDPAAMGMEFMGIARGMAMDAGDAEVYATACHVTDGVIEANGSETEPIALVVAPTRTILLTADHTTCWGVVVALQRLGYNRTDKGGDGSAATLQRGDWRIMASRNRIVKERNSTNE